MTEEQTLADAIDLIKSTTPKGDPWTGADISEDAKTATDTDDAIARILNAVVAGELVPPVTADDDATIARLTEQVNTLTTEKHADAEAIRTLWDALSKRAMERDEAKRELEAMRNSGSWHKDDAIDRIEEAARAALERAQARVAELQAFVADFADAKFPRIDCRAPDPQDDLDPLTDYLTVEAWQDDARALARKEGE